MPVLFLTRAGWGGDYFQCPVVVVAKMAKEDMRATLDSDLRMLVGASARAQLLLLPLAHVVLHIVNSRTPTATSFRFQSLA